MRRLIHVFAAAVALAGLVACSGSQKGPDPNFHIYLCLGQSNMEGVARPEAVDSVANPDFLVLAAATFPDSTRVTGRWYTAVPPLCRHDSGLTPADWFGRTMLEHYPEGHRLGVVNVAVGGIKIEGFMQENAAQYAADAPDWMKYKLQFYDNDCYGRLLEMARLAQKEGVIEGILMHQGEANCDDPEWPGKVKVVYERLLADLGLKAENVPLLCGQVVCEEAGGWNAIANPMIARINETIPTAWCISSEGLNCLPDRLHFDAEGYRELGRRYAAKMLDLKGLE